MKNAIYIQCKNLVGYLAAMTVAVFLGGCAESPKFSSSGEPLAVRANQLLTKAYEHMVRNEDAAAERILLDARLLEPGNPWVALDLGVIYQRRGQVEMARAEYRKVLASPTSDLKAASVSGTLLNGASLQKIALHNLNILGEVGSASRMAAVSAPLVKPSQISVPRQGDINGDTDTKSLQLAIETWRSAWQNRDVNAYLNCYQRDFRGTKPERKAWEAYRRKQIEGAVGRIDLHIQEMQIIVRGEEAQVRFKQHYRADNFTDAGNKELSLVRADGKWLINKEFFEPAGK